MRKTTFVPTALSLFASLALAQTELATLTGSVTDQSGAMLRSVTVTVFNQATNLPASTQVG
ncbi:MAG: hypothetical protein JJE04_26935 [Acidobacteriia bacterium]|nr:hypothetical protein [Terriglobia bacterium]